MVKCLFFHFGLVLWLDFPGGASGKESTCQGGRCRRCRFDLYVRKIPGSKKWQFTPVFLLGKLPGGLQFRGVTKSWTGLSKWALDGLLRPLTSKLFFFSLPSHPSSRQKNATQSLNKTGICGLHWISRNQTYRPVLGEEGQLISTNIPIYLSNST